MNNLNILSLNCQKGYHQDLENFLAVILNSNFYDFLLLQEADEKVLTMIQDRGSYKLLRAVNPDIGKHSHLGIMYRDNFKLNKTYFVSFSKMNKMFALRGEPGFLIGIFDCRGQKLVLGSMHLHPSFPFHLRMREMALIKNKLLSLNKTIPVIFGGDCNLGFPWEGWYIKKIFSPEFKDASAGLTPTLNSKYTEKGTHLAGKIGNLLAVCGIHLNFHTDKIFVDQKISQQIKLTPRVLPDRVSDHSPVELMLQNAKN